MTVTASAAALAAGCGVVAVCEAWALLRLGRRGRARVPAQRLRGLLAAAARLTGRPGPPRDLPARLLAAGAPPWLGTGEVMAAKLAAACCGGLVALVVGPLLPGRLGTLTLVLAPALGFLAPDLALVRRTQRRVRAARAEAPELLDRVRMVADAGLSPAEALGRAARDGHGPLAAELRAVADAGSWGAGREEALRRLATAIPVPEAHALAAAVIRSERHGAPLGPAVAALAAGARAERARRVRDRAQRAAPKIQLVVALLLVPAVLLLVAAGLLAGLR